MPHDLKLASGTGHSIIVDRCQVCSATDLEPVLFLGFLPPVNRMQPVADRPSEQPAYPAQLFFCPRCQLVQIGLIIDPQILFPPDYPYTSGTTAILRANFSELYRECRAMLSLKESDLIVDVGSNDGTLLSNFQRGGHQVQGIEPTDMGRLAEVRGIPTRVSFFNRATADWARNTRGPARVLTATNVFAHMEDIHGIVEALLLLLSDDGLFVSESHYLHSLIETVQYDTIYHEHLRYYSLASLKYLLAMHDLEVVHAKRIPTHGGSLRVYAARRGRHKVGPSVAAMLAAEDAAGPCLGMLRSFRDTVIRSKMALHALLADVRRGGKRIYGIGAPSRASTLINYVGIDDGLVDCVLEVPGSHKVGKYMPGTLIPVLDESRLFADQPEYALLFSWHIAGELVPKLVSKGYRGAFIVPLPAPRIIRP